MDSPEARIFYGSDWLGGGLPMGGGRERVAESIYPDSSLKTRESLGRRSLGLMAIALVGIVLILGACSYGDDSLAETPTPILGMPPASTLSTAIPTPISRPSPTPSLEFAHFPPLQPPKSDCRSEVKVDYVNTENFLVDVERTKAFLTSLGICDQKITFRVIVVRDPGNTNFSQIAFGKGNEHTLTLDCSGVASPPSKERPWPAGNAQPGESPALPSAQACDQRAKHELGHFYRWIGSGRTTYWGSKDTHFKADDFARAFPGFTLVKER